MAMKGRAMSPPPHPPHTGELVRAGPYQVLAGGGADLLPDDLTRADVLVPLAGFAHFGLGRRYDVIGCPWRDYAGPPPGWQEFLKEIILPELEAGRRLLVFCHAGHGRTGTFLASLIALLESPDETPYPVLATRERYCERAVETEAQLMAVAALPRPNGRDAV